MSDQYPDNVLCLGVTLMLRMEIVLVKTTIHILCFPDMLLIFIHFTCDDQTLTDDWMWTETKKNTDS